HKIIYSSNSPEVATVDENGNIKAISSGTATITVKAEENDVKQQIIIEVYSKVTGIKLDQKQIYMQIGDIFKINPVVEPEDANDKSLKYQIINQDIATSDEYGNITAHKEGETTLEVIANQNNQI